MENIDFDMSELDLEQIASDEQLECVIEFIEKNFNTESNYDSQFKNAVKLSNFLKLNNITIGEIGAEKLLSKSVKLNDMFKSIYLADKLIKVFQYNNMISCRLRFSCKWIYFRNFFYFISPKFYSYSCFTFI